MTWFSSAPAACVSCAIRRGKCSLHVREMYEQDGQLLPGKVGVTLDASAVTALVQAADALTAAAQKRGAAASSGVAPQQQAKTATASAAMQENVRPSAGDKPGGSGGSGSGEEFVDLGGDRRASVSNFKGRSGVDLREYYKVRGLAALRRSRRALQQCCIPQRVRSDVEGACSRWPRHEGGKILHECRAACALGNHRDMLSKAFTAVDKVESAQHHANMPQRLWDVLCVHLCGTCWLCCVTN